MSGGTEQIIKKDKTEKNRENQKPTYLKTDPAKNCFNLSARIFMRLSRLSWIRPDSFSKNGMKKERRENQNLT
jgi:hypothetical protein